MSEGKIWIGIGHKARHGKDSFARALHALMPADSRIIGFADALKTYCRVEYGMPEKNAPLLQRVGLAMRENRGENIWINVLRHTAEEFTERVIICPDVRFENEAEFIRRQGMNGTLIRITRLNPDLTTFVSADRDPHHPSEVALDGYYGWDYAFSATNAEQVRRAAKLFWKTHPALRDYAPHNQSAQAA